MLQNLLQSLAQGILILTPNRRLAGFLEREYAKAQNAVVWETPKIYSLSCWQQKLWNEWEFLDHSLPAVLNAHQDRSLWETIIPEGNRSLVKSIMDAWELCISWRVSLQDALTPETQAYCEWSVQYQTQCKQNHWVDFASMVEILTDGIKRQNVPIPKAIVCVGFDEWTPQSRAFYETLKGVACVSKKNFCVFSPEIYKTVLDTENTEIQTALRWAEKQIEQDPNVSIAIVVPELERLRKAILRELEKSSVVTKTNVSAPVPMKHYSMIQDALLCFKMLFDPIEFNALSVLLRSPYLGVQCDRGDLQLRAHVEPKGTLEYYRRLSREEPWYFSTFSEHKCNTQGVKSAQQWVTVLLDLLNALGWPGKRTLDTNEHHLLTQWQVLLEQYLQLECVLKKHSLPKAIRCLEKLATEMTFLPEMKNANVHIYGVLEAAGIPFDAVWMMGMHSEGWPTNPAPNPFIPLSLQKRLNLPRSSSARELEVARRLMQTFCNTIQAQLIFSTPREIDQRTVGFSALVKGFPEYHSPAKREQSAQRVSEGYLEEYNELPIPQLKNSETALGGIKPLQLQALCPFRAFAEVRLKSKAPNRPVYGLTAGQRGEIVHQVLAELNTWQAEEVKEIIEKIIQKWAKKHPLKLPANIKKIEKNRILALIKRFLALEANRDPFDIKAKEQKQKITIGPLTLSVRLDRVDRLSNGQELVIDYKTGKSSVSDWFGDRPTEPQLPLYCVGQDNAPAGAVLVDIQANSVQYKGLIEIADKVPKVKVLDSWQEQLNSWKDVLEQLAEQFAKGEVRVDPKQGEYTCGTCTQQAFCRIALSEQG